MGTSNKWVGDYEVGAFLRVNSNSTTSRWLDDFRRGPGREKCKRGALLP